MYAFQPSYVLLVCRRLCFRACLQPHGDPVVRPQHARHLASLVVYAAPRPDVHLREGLEGALAACQAQCWGPGTLLAQVGSKASTASGWCIFSARLQSQQQRRPVQPGAPVQGWLSGARGVRCAGRLRKVCMAGSRFLAQKLRPRLELSASHLEFLVKQLPAGTVPLQAHALVGCAAHSCPTHI